MALNKVIAGEYVGSNISVWEDGSVSISSNGGIKLNKEYVTNYKIITQNVKYVDGKYSLIDCDEKVFDGILKNIY